MLERFSRTGWLGIPVGFAVACATLLFWFNDDVALLAGLLVAGAGGAKLPHPDRWVAVCAGALAAWLLMFVIPQGGADSPLNMIGAVCSASFAIGALLVSLIVGFRSHGPNLRAD